MVQNPVEVATCALNPILFGEIWIALRSNLRCGVALVVENICDLVDKIRKFFENIDHNALKVVKLQNGAISFTVGENKKI